MKTPGDTFSPAFAPGFASRGTTLAAWKKVLLFGLFGAAGCLAGWAVGELYFLAAYAATGSGTGQARTLISKPAAQTTAPPPSNAFKQRLDAVGAKTGDIQISLMWFNENDLDLHCIDPSGEEIFFGHRQSRSGGRLDVDANREGSPITPTPVENIYWEKGTAPQGRYRVYVNHYLWRKDRAPNETEFEVTVLRGNERTDIPVRPAGGGEPTGPRLKITNNGTTDNKQFVFEFTVAPRVEVFSAPDVTVHTGETVRVPVSVRRSFFQGDLEIGAENLPDGVTASKGTIRAGEDDGELELKASSSAEPKKPGKFRIVVTAPSVTGGTDADLSVKLPPFSLTSVIIIGIWTAILAVGLCLALLAGQNRYLHRPLFAASRIPLVLVILGGSFAGFASGFVGQSLYSVLLSLGVGSLGFIIGWILLGGLLGWGVSFFVSNMERKKAALAGLAGGLLGAAVYFIGSRADDIIGRLAGAAALGFCIGLVVAIVEAAYRRVWLEVRFGEREKIRVNLGSQAVQVGGNAQLCTVWARGAADVALRFFVRDGKVICEDVPTRTETVLGDGHTRTAGTVTLTVRTGTTPAMVAPSLPAPTGVLTPARPAATPQAAKPAELPPPAPTGGLTPPARPETPAPKAPVPAAPGFDDGLPMPISPVAPARPKVASILDGDYLPPAAPQAAKPVAAKPTRGLTPPARPAAPAVAPKPPAPAAPKPPAPTGGLTPPARPAAPSAPAASPNADAEGCPTCKRKSPGRPGARYCMFCDKTY